MVIKILTYVAIFFISSIYFVALVSAGVSMGLKNFFKDRKNDGSK